MGVAKENQCYLISAVMFCVAGLLWYQFYTYSTMDLVSILTGCCGIVSLVLAVVTLDMAQLDPANSHTLKSLISQYLFNSFMTLYGFYTRRIFDNRTKNIRHTQEEILLHQIIRPNELTEFGQKHNFKGIHSRADYRFEVPITTYEYYLPYIKSIEEDPKSLQGLLSEAPVIFLAITSGSTGENKVIPVGKDLRANGLFLYSLIFDSVRQKAGRSLQRMVKLGYRPLVSVSETGLTKAPISHHLQRNLPFSLIPVEVYDITNEHDALYVEAVLAMADREVGVIQGFMSTLVWTFWRLIEQNWRQMCDDIETGTINDSICIKPYIRVVVERQMQDKKRVKRANDLRIQFNNGYVGIARRLWPRLHYVDMLTSGCFANYARSLCETYMQDITQYSMLHAASEAFVGVATTNTLSDRITPRYSLCAPLVYLEFIGVEEAGDMEERKEMEEPKLFYPEELKVGKCYEVVSSCPMGLYRYRLGDVIKVVDLHNQCPIYEFLYRTGHVLNVSWEKTPENVMYDAVNCSCNQLGLVLIDYTTTEDVVLTPIPGYQTNTSIKHYVIFLEATRKRCTRTPANLTADEKTLVDERLCSRMELYGTLRKKDSIGPLHVVEVKLGTFGDLRAKMLGKHNNPLLKMPRVIRDTALLSFLLLSRLTE